MYPRHITRNLMAALRDTPVVILHGGRQTGKSTLVQQLTEHGYHATYITLDNATALATARRDPVGFLAAVNGSMIIDEVQRAPELVLPMKADVDRDRRPGRFLLTGSAHVMQIPRLADAFVGRSEVLTLRPLSQGEMAGAAERFVDAVFGNKLMKLVSARVGKQRAVTRDHLARRILAGGFPEAVGRRSAERRRVWFESYLSNVQMREVRELADIEGLGDLPRLIAAVAGRAGGLLNYAELGRDVGLNQVTVRRYLALLRATFLVQPLQPWFTNRIKRIVKSEKIYLSDSGLLGHLLDATPERIAADGKLAGRLLENFVAAELLKQVSWSNTKPTVWHFRDHRGHEVDFVLEGRGGRKLVGIEVKWSSTLSASDTNGLRVLAEVAGDAFCAGVILYGGQEVLPLGTKLYAMPVSALWEAGAE